MEEKDIKKEELEFVHDNDLLPVLEKLGLQNDFLAGKIKCAFCGAVITSENLYSLFEDNGVKVSCNKEDCIKGVGEKK